MDMELHRFRAPLYIALITAAFAAVGSALQYTKSVAKVDGSFEQQIDGRNTQEQVNVEDGMVTMLAVGDLMLGRSVETAMKVNGDEYIFAKVGDLFSGYDLTFGNFEGTSPDHHVVTPPGSFRFNFRREVIPQLVAQGFDVVSLANNHALDFGQKGFDQTAAALEAAGIAHVGHYSDEDYDFYETEIRGKKFLMVAFNVIEPDFDEDAAIAWTEQVAARPHDVFLASVHWGAEYVHTPARETRRFAERLVDAGIDVVLGGHPHVVQTIGSYKGKTIVYSMGNFVFDQYWSEQTQLGMAVALTFDFSEGKSAKILLRPIPIDLHGSQPRTYEENRIPAWRKWLVGISDDAVKGMVESGVITQ